MSILSFGRFEIKLYLLERWIQCLSHIQWLYHSSALSCIQRRIHQASYSSTNLYLVLYLTIKTYPMRLLTFQTFSYSLKCSKTLSLRFLRSIFFIFRVFDFIVLFYTSFTTFFIVYILSEIFSIFVSFGIFLDMAKVTPFRTPKPL